MNERIFEEINDIAGLAWETHHIAQLADRFSLIRVSSLAEKVITMLSAYVDKSHPGQIIDDVYLNLDQKAVGMQARYHGVEEFIEDGGIDNITFEERYNLLGIKHRRQLVIHGFHPEVEGSWDLTYGFCGWDVTKTERLITDKETITTNSGVDEADINLMTQVLKAVYDKVGNKLTHYSDRFNRRL